MLQHWIWLAELNIPERRKRELLERYGTAEAIFSEDISQYLGLPESERQALGQKSLDSANQILDICDEKRIAVLSLQDREYPDRLRNIFDPPIVLYCKGKLPDVDSSLTIGMVGTRKASAYGLTTARKLGYQVAAGGGTVVSGMARGIDSAAMDGALLAGKKVIGVLGTGVDVCYPKSSQKIYEQTIHQGCILSEYKPGTGADGWHFPRRNRIISGLSVGTVVIESPEISGSLKTAAFAAEQGRDVFVVPGNVDMPGFVGSNRLLRDGAIAVSSGWDILSEYAHLYPNTLSKTDAQMIPEPAGPIPMQPQDNKVICASSAGSGIMRSKKIIDKPAASAYSDPAGKIDSLSGNEKVIAKLLCDGERLVDDVIAESGISAGKTMAILTMLEIKGIVKRLPGKRICLKGK